MVAPVVVDVAAETGSAGPVEGRDPRLDPRVGDVLEDDESRVDVTWLGAPTERPDHRGVEGTRSGWRRRVRGEPERLPEDRGWTVGSWVALMARARVLAVAGAIPAAEEVPGG